MRDVRRHEPGAGAAFCTEDRAGPATHVPPVAELVRALRPRHARPSSRPGTVPVLIDPRRSSGLSAEAPDPDRPAHAAARFVTASRPIWRMRLARETPRYLLSAAATCGLLASARFAIAPPTPGFSAGGSRPPATGSRRRKLRSPVRAPLPDVGSGQAAGGSPGPAVVHRARDGTGRRRGPSRQRRAAGRMGGSRTGAAIGARHQRLHGRRPDRHGRTALPHRGCHAGCRWSPATSGLPRLRGAAVLGPRIPARAGARTG